jgi:hydrogenase maturation protease
VSRVVIGVGNGWRGDDAAGLEVARRIATAGPDGVRAVALEGEQSGLLEAWTAADDVAIVDACASGAAPGTLHRHDARAAPLPAHLSRSSTHAFGVAEAVELARALDRLPRTLTVYAIEGGSFALGERLTPPVARAVGALADELARA